MAGVHRPRSSVSSTNKGAPGVDGRDFAEIDAYGVERWLGELRSANGILAPVIS